jgi:hypothetical protein
VLRIARVLEAVREVVAGGEEQLAVEAVPRAPARPCGRVRVTVANAPTRRAKTIIAATTPTTTPMERSLVATTTATVTTMTTVSPTGIRRRGGGPDAVPVERSDADHHHDRHQCSHGDLGAGRSAIAHPDERFP